MNILKSKSLIILVIGMISFVACKKQPGEGGKATIKGNLWVEDYNGSFTLLNGAYNGADIDVYIIYGDNVGYNDKTSANYKGEFEFKYLRKGKYTIYTYSKFRTIPAPAGDSAIVKTIEIKDKKETIDLGKITIYD